MKETQERSHIVSEKPEQTKERLRNQTFRLTNQRIDLERIKREGIRPTYHPLASGFQGSLEEAIELNDRVRFNTWREIQEMGDDGLIFDAEKERQRFADFQNKPLDDR